MGKGTIEQKQAKRQAMNTLIAYQEAVNPLALACLRALEAVEAFLKKYYDVNDPDIQRKVDYLLQEVFGAQHNQKGDWQQGLTDIKKLFQAQGDAFVTWSYSDPDENFKNERAERVLRITEKCGFFATTSATPAPRLPFTESKAHKIPRLQRVAKSVLNFLAGIIRCHPYQRLLRCETAYENLIDTLEISQKDLIETSKKARAVEVHRVTDKMIDASRSLLEKRRKEDYDMGGISLPIPKKVSRPNSTFFRAVAAAVRGQQFQAPTPTK